MTNAISGETLVLAASCRYVLTAALPPISVNVSIQDGAVLERSSAPGTPVFSILAVTSARHLSVSHLSFGNGYGGAITTGGPSAGTITVTGGAFTGNTAGAINNDGFYALTVNGSSFTGNAGGAVNAGLPPTQGLPGNGRDATTVTHSAFTGNTGGAINADGVYPSDPGTLAVTGSSFTGNTGGAINNNGFALTVTRASFTGNTGGAINNNGFALTVTRASFTSNTGGAINTPGGIAFQQVPLTTVTDTTFTRNTGGGITCTLGTKCDVSVAHCAFTRNAGSGLSYPFGREDVSFSFLVTDSIFTGNTAEYGGGIDLDSILGGELTATGDTFTGNTATAAGGGIYNYDGVTATGDTFTGNTAGAGGGIDNDWAATVQDSTFRDNNASDGGALFNRGSLSVTGSILDSNKASTDGGAIYQQFALFGPAGPLMAATLTISGSQILRNHAGQYGGGIDNTAEYSQGTVAVAITGSQVRSDTAKTDGGGIENSGGPVTLTHAVIDDNHPDNCAPPNSVPGCTG